MFFSFLNNLRFVIVVYKYNIKDIIQIMENRKISIFENSNTIEHMSSVRVHNVKDNKNLLKCFIKTLLNIKFYI